jgi:DNA polymerase-3 subunit gamma/tau
MAPETVLEHLTRVLAQESVPAEPQALRLLARAARGSMRDALSLTDQAIAFGSGQLQEAGVRQMLGAVDRSHVLRLIEALALGDGRAVVETSDTLRINGLSAASTLEDMCAVLQRMAVLQAVPQMAEAMDGSDPEAAQTVRLAQLLPADETQLLYSICLHGRTELGLAPDEYAALTMALLRLLAFKPPGFVPSSVEKKTLTPAEPVPPVPPTGTEPAPTLHTAPEPPAPDDHEAFGATEAPFEESFAAPQPTDAPAPIALPVRSIEEVAQRVSVEPPAVHEPPPVMRIPVREAPEPGPRLQPQEPGAAAARFTPTPEGTFWHTTVQGLIAAEAITALVRELALQSQLVARDGAHWMVRVERESLNQPTARERLRAALEAAGHAQQLTVEVGTVTDTPARRNAAAAAERQRVAEDIVNNDPTVQALVREHGARIVPGSIKPVHP